MSASLVRQRRGVRARRGSALLLVLVAMVVLAVLATASMMSAFQEARSSRAAQIQQRALAVAEFGLNQQLANWPAQRGTMQPGAIEERQVVVSLGDEAIVRVQRLNSIDYNVVSVGRAGIGNGLMEAQRQVSLLVKLSSPSIVPAGMFTTFGTVNVSGSMSITGTNTTPPGWSGCSTSPNTFGLTYNPARPPTGNKLKDVVGGTSADPRAADPNTYTVFGDETWTSLVAKANARVTSGSANASPSATNGTCNTAASLNWGEPRRVSGSITSCANYFPIIYSSGNLTASGRGQGVLIVNGSLKMINFEFVGLVLVRDHIENGGGSGLLHGAVMIRSVNNQTSRLNANHTFRYSRCGLDQALSSLSTPARPKERAWTNIY